MHETSIPITESRLRGTLATKVAAKAGSTAVGKLRGSLLRSREGGEDTPVSLIPKGYDWPAEATAALSLKMSAIEGKYTPYVDPNEAIRPGAVFTNPADPTRRRLVVSTYTYESGKNIVVMHIEGETMLRNVRPELVRQKIDEGMLIPVPVTE